MPARYKRTFSLAVVAIGVGQFLCCAAETPLSAMYRAEAEGDFRTARAIAMRLSNEGETAQRFSAIRLLQRQKEYTAVAEAAEDASRKSTSDVYRTELLELQTGALLALGRHEDAIEACRASVTQLPQQPLRHLSLARALATAYPDEALGEVREAILLLPAWDRVHQMRDSEGQQTNDRYYEQALELYGALRRKTAPPGVTRDQTDDSLVGDGGISQ